MARTKSTQTVPAPEREGMAVPADDLPKLDDVFGPGGRLSEHMDNFEYRPQQIEAAETIERALSNRRKCIVEAGTGVGKSLAYLAPIALELAARPLTSDGLKRRAVVSTYTINLQEQLVTKDIPILQAVLPEAPVKACLLKGKGNYLCKQDLDTAGGDLFHTAEPLFKRLRSWATRTRTGDRAELTFDYPHWGEVACNSDTCRVSECRYFDTCHYYQTRKRAAACNLIVVNHALLLTDLVAAETSADGQGIIPPYDVLVVDEAHHLEDSATSALDLEVGDWEVPVLAERIRRTEAAPELVACLSRMEELSAALFGRMYRRGYEFQLPEGIGADEWAGFVPEAASLTALLRQAGAELTATSVEAEEPDKTRLLGLAQVATRLGGALDSLAGDAQQGFVKWCEAGPRHTRRQGRQRGSGQRAVLHDSPIEVSGLLREKLWTKAPSAVLTSATLANSGAFTYLRSRLGLPDDLDEGIIGSPFNFGEQALLYVPAHLPAPQKEPGAAYFDAVADEIARIVMLSEGRAFILFTSRRALDEAHTRLLARVPFPLFRQGDMPPPKLLQAYRDSGSGCLLGNQTFWEGVDVQGAALSVVIIDRIPFGVPDSPITRARTDAITAAGGDWFADFSVPQAQIRLKQGFGRLIRTRSDRGIVCILDSRLVTRSYGPEFVRHLPPASRASIWPRVERFWRQ